MIHKKWWMYERYKPKITKPQESATVPTGIVALIHSTKFFIRTDNSTKHDTQRHKKNISKIAKNLKICFFMPFFVLHIFTGCIAGAGVLRKRQMKYI